MRMIILSIVFLMGCATPRTNGILGLNFSEHPPRAAIRLVCNGEEYTTQGTAVCEQKGPSEAKITVKIPPLEGRVVYSNGQIKKTDDFNWYPTQGFWIWKKKPIKDTWADLDLGEISSALGDWPVALDIIGVSDRAGTIVTRGLIYHRVCNDQDVPCSRLAVGFQCAGHSKQTGPFNIGKCDRLSGSTQDFEVELKTPEYTATPGAKIYLSAPRLGIKSSVYTPTEADFSRGFSKIEVPQVLNGPTLIGIRMAWIESSKILQEETRILIVGYSPDWTGLDQPHLLPSNHGVDFVKPVLADIMEVNLYDGQELKKKSYSTDKVINFPKPSGTQIACAFAWQRDSSDQTVYCVNAGLEEVPLP